MVQLDPDPGTLGRRGGDLAVLDGGRSGERTRGAMFDADGSKSALGSPADAALQRLAAEIRRAEYVHWANLAAGGAFWLVLPPWAAIAVAGFAMAVHLPFIVVQRYNRARIESILARRRRA